MTPDLSRDAADKLTTVVENWGREVANAQQRLEQQIRAAALELSQIEGLLSERRVQPGREDLLHEIDRLRAENAELRAALAKAERRINELTGER